jgi:E3 ubiquitin-protein ligase TRIP12
MLETFRAEKEKILNGPGSDGQKQELVRNITVKNLKIEDLYLDFTLPGYPDIDLVKNGKDIMLSIENVEEYIEAIIDMTVGSGVKYQVDAFRKGFDRVFPIKDLHCFSLQELVVLMGGEQKEDWSLKGSIFFINFKLLMSVFLQIMAIPEIHSQF